MEEFGNLLLESNKTIQSNINDIHDRLTVIETNNTIESLNDIHDRLTVIENNNTIGSGTTYIQGEGIHINNNEIKVESLYFDNWNTAYSWGDHSVVGYLNNVIISAPVSNQFLTYNGTNWINVNPDTDDISEGLSNLYYTYQRVDARIAQASLGDLNNVNVTTPDTGEILSYNGTNWVRDGTIKSLTGTLDGTSYDYINVTAPQHVKASWSYFTSLSITAPHASMRLDGGLFISSKAPVTDSSDNKQVLGAFQNQFGPTPTDLEVDFMVEGTSMLIGDTFIGPNGNLVLFGDILSNSGQTILGSGGIVFDSHLSVWNEDTPKTYSSGLDGEVLVSQGHNKPPKWTQEIVINTITATGEISGDSLTDGTATLSGGSLSGVVNITATGIITTESLIVTDVATFSDNGNVGIGTQTPSQKLDVNGRINIGEAPDTDSGVTMQINGGIYVNGSSGIRIPRGNTYNYPAEREWWINFTPVVGELGDGTNALTILFSAATERGAPPDFVAKHRLHPGGNAEWAGAITGSVNFSDDRLKTNEMYLMNATESLLKLSVQTYDKEKVNNFSLLERTGEKVRETGLIAQEVYYNAPEFRHLINCGIEYNDENPEGTLVIPDEMDLNGVPIGEDPDYEGAGWSKTSAASVEYQGFIAYLIKSIQELHTLVEKSEARIQILESK